MASPSTSIFPFFAAADRPAWQSALAEAVRDPAELCRLTGLDPSLAEEARLAAGGFPLLVPRPYLARIRRGDPADPLLAQVLPRALEQAETPGFTADPLGETEAQCIPGVLGKYPGRLLIVATGACGVHCRFCFRRHFAYPQISWESAIDRLAGEQSVEEVILSGGDPLILPDEQLTQIANRLAAIPHVRRLRLHTRLPIVIPDRVTDGLLACLRATRLTPLMVVHVNHPAELDDAVAAALGRLIDAGVPVLSQSVLLRGVNDDVGVLTALFRRLVDLRVMPYYLHQLDAVAGAAHFEVPVAVGKQLIAQLRALLPGYAVPRYVRETRGAAGKSALA